MVSVFGLPPLAPNRPLPRAIFDGICDVLCTSSTPQKRAGFFASGGGSAPPARLPIAKATPHAMRSNMPGIRCLVHRRIEGLPPMPPTPKTRESKVHVEYEDKFENMYISLGGRNIQVDSERSSKVDESPASNCLWRDASETYEQQQDSCPNHAKQPREKRPKRCLRNAVKS